MSSDPAGTRRPLPFDAARLARAVPVAWGGAGILVAAIAVLTHTGAIPIRGVHGKILAGAYAGTSYVVLLAYLRLRALAAGRAPRARSGAVRAVRGAAVWSGFGIFLLVCLDAAASYDYENWSNFPDLRVNHVWRPGATARNDWVADANPEYPERFRLVSNAQGWIETYDIVREKPPGTFRIFYLGDSFTQGCVPMDQSVASVVERELNARVRDGALRIEVVDTGTPSYSPILYDVLTRHVLSEFGPDLLVVNVDMTDDFDDWKYERTARYDGEGRPLAVPPRDVVGDSFVETGGGVTRTTAGDRVRLWLLKHTHLFHYLADLRSRIEPPPDARRTAQAGPAEALGSGARDRIYQRWAWCREEWDEFTAANVARTLGHLRRLVAWCRENGVRVVVTSVPHHEQYARGGPEGERWSDRPHREIAAAAREAGALYLDSLGALRQHVEGTEHHEYYYRGDMHFNPRGNALWAAAHVKFLLDPSHRLLPEAVYADR